MESLPNIIKIEKSENCAVIKFDDAIQIKEEPEVEFELIDSHQVVNKTKKPSESIKFKDWIKNNAVEEHPERPRRTQKRLYEMSHDESSLEKEQKRPRMILNKNLSTEKKQKPQITQSNPVGPFECQLCPAVLKTRKLFNYHTALHLESFKCEICGKKFPAQFQLDAHKVVHENPEIFKCKICFKILSSKVQLRNHMMKVTHSRDEKKKFKCDKCDYSTNYKTELLKHPKVHEAFERKLKSRSDWFRCEKCPMCLFTCPETLAKHHRIKHTNLPLLECDFCGFNSSDRCVMKNHIHVVHLKISRYPSNSTKTSKAPIRPNADGLYVCEYCSKILSTKKSLQSHVKIHLETFKCEICLKAFHTRYLLLDHKVQHENSEHFKCEICLKVFTTSSGLKKHMKNVAHGGLNAEKAYKCDKCEYSTNYKKVTLF